MPYAYVCVYIYLCANVRDIYVQEEERVRVM